MCSKNMSVNLADLIIYLLLFLNNSRALCLSWFLPSSGRFSFILLLYYFYLAYFFKHYIIVVFFDIFVFFCNFKLCDCFLMANKICKCRSLYQNISHTDLCAYCRFWIPNSFFTSRHWHDLSVRRPKSTEAFKHASLKFDEILICM